MALWITYAWVDNEEGNFDYLIQVLAGAGIETRYDRVAIVPGRRLWEQIAAHIESPETQAWAFLITRNSLSSQPCLEELYYALDRTFRAKGANFPLIGLLADGVPFAEMPAPLRTRLCISLGNPNWIEQVRAAILGQAPQVNAEAQSPYIINVGQTADGNSIIEIRPRFGELHNWRIAVPRSFEIVHFGPGPAGTLDINGTQTNRLEGTVDLNGQQMAFVGTGGPLTPGTSAYVKIRGRFSGMFAFGTSPDAFGVPNQWQAYGAQ